MEKERPTVTQTHQSSQTHHQADSEPRPNPVVRFLRQLVFPALLLLGSAFVTAILPFLDGSDLAHAVFRAREAEREPDPEVLEAIRTELDLPDTAADGVASWFGHALPGDLGVSWLDP